MKKVFPKCLWAGLAVAASLVAAACSSGPTCGANTHLDTALNQCVADPPALNIIVDNFKVGDFSMKEVDVPEQLQVGTPDTRTFTITNEGPDDRDVVMIRYGIAPVQETIQELRDKIDEMTDGSELGAEFLGVVVLEDLKTGESRTVEYHINVPETIADGMYGFLFAVDELPLRTQEDGTPGLDYSQPSLSQAEGQVRLGSAALVHAAATVIVGKPDKPNLRVLYANSDNASFELDDTEESKRPMFTVTARMSSQGMNLPDPVTARFELKLPGHTPATPGQDLGPAWFEAKGLDFDAAPEATQWVYDANRTFELLFRQDEGLVASRTYESECRLEWAQVDAPDGGEPTAEQIETCAVIYNEEGRDDVYELHLKQEDAQLLGMTRDLETFNPDLDTDGEIAGELVYTISTPAAEYADNLADNVETLPVVFMAPEAQRAATDTDEDDMASTDASNGLTGPYPYVLKDDLSTKSYGNTWFGASYRFENTSNVDKRFNVVVAGYRSATAKTSLTVLKQPIDVVNLTGMLDWNSSQLPSLWKAVFKLNVLNYTVADVGYKPSYCDTQDNVTFCPLFEQELPEEDKPEKEATKSESDTPGPLKKLAKAVHQAEDYYFTAGPVPFLVKTDLGLSGGVSFTGKFVIDKRSAVPMFGVEFALGPSVEIKASVFGGITLGLARAGVEGTLTFIKAEFVPTVRPVARLLWDDTRACFKYATASVTTEGPFTLSALSGTVSAVGYLGFKSCFWGKCWKWETKVFSYTFASFSTWSNTWYAWKSTSGWARKPGDPGMCSDALPAPAQRVWRSPTSCSGGTYCNSSSTGTRTSRSPDKVLAAYKDTLTLSGTSTTCADVTVVGTTETSNDVVVIYDQNKKAQNSEAYGSTTQPGWSGSINKTVRVCSPQITAALETNSSSTRTGVTVTFKPVQ